MTQLINGLESLKLLSDATISLVQKLSKSVVSVNSHISQGTGVALEKGYIATCNHVLAGCNTVRIGQDEKTFESRVVGVDVYSDLALLKTEQGNFELPFNTMGNLFRPQRRTSSAQLPAVKSFKTGIFCHHGRLGRSAE